VLKLKKIIPAPKGSVTKIITDVQLPYYRRIVTLQIDRDQKVQIILHKRGTDINRLNIIGPVSNLRNVS